MTVPDGWVLVPREPTEKMLKAAFVAMNETPSGTWKRMKADGSTPRRMFDVKMAPRYRAMIAAAPPPPAQPPITEGEIDAMATAIWGVDGDGLRFTHVHEGIRAAYHNAALAAWNAAPDRLKVMT